MRTGYLVILALLCFSAFTWTNSCPGFYSGDRLQTGKYIFMKMGNNREYSYEAPISFQAGNRAIEIATTAGTIGNYDPSSGGFSFQINGQKKPSANFAQFTLIANNAGWTSIQISYMFSARDDFAIGNYNSPVNSWGRGQSADSYNVDIPIGKTLTSGSYKVAVFISGFSTSDNQFQISVNSRNFDQRSNRISVSIYCGAYPQPTSITFTYVIYPDNHPILEISYGSVAGEMGAYQISGPTSFTSSNNIEYNEFRIANRYLACTGNECEGTCTLRERCAEQGGNIYEGQCTFCAPGIIFDSGTCLRKCGPNQTFTNRVCICNPGLERRGNACVQPGGGSGTGCRGNEINWNGNCRACPPGARPDSAQSTCLCNSGQYDPNQNVCGASCGFGEVQDNNRRCVCANNFGRYNGQCRQCPAGSFSNNREECVCSAPNTYDPQSNACTSSCGFGQVWNGQRCVCQQGWISWNGQCRQCPAGSSPNNGQSTCVCGGGLTYDPQSNACASNCGSGQVWNGQRCVCVQGWISWNGQCRQCPAGSSPNNVQTSCVCNNGQAYDINSNSCSVRCPPNQVLVGNQCVCNGYVYNRECRPCPANTRPNQARNTCECLDGSNFDAASNRCVPRCPNNEVLRNGRCECISGSARLNGVCQQCPKSSTPSGNTCQCTSANAIYIANSNLCVECGANSSPNAAKTACNCGAGYIPQGNICVAAQRCEFNEDLVNGRCECKYGWIRLGPSCVEACGINEYYDGKNCFCKEGHAKSSGVCRPCPAGTVPNAGKTTCICSDPTQFYVAASNSCQACQANSYPSADFTNCVCKSGYTNRNNQCVSNCPGEAFPNADGLCVCPAGKVYNGNSCVVPISCPDRSTFNPATRTCVCNNNRENFIDGVCATCGPNSVWKQDQCVCNTGYFLIGGECRVCDPRTKYNGKDCVCNLGYFGNRDLCTPCHKSCSQCTGPEANQCLSCSDVSLVLQKGYCSKNSPCDFGFFLDNGQCTKCLDNCLDCESIFECKTCAIGFRTKSQSISGQTIVSCDEICGDGIKYEQQCDDGNTNNGDGCNSKCEEETGWFCSGGSSSNPSKCRKLVENQVQLSSKGAVNLGSSVILSVRASYLPPCLTQNECSTCFKAIKVNVVNANVPILVTINFVPLSQWQYVIKFDFQGLIVTSIFKVVIRLNEEFKGCIDQLDFNEQLELTIDPAFLAKNDEVTELTLADLNPQPGQPPKISIPKSALRNLGL